jgi:hypothetical protein
LASSPQCCPRHLFSIKNYLSASVAQSTAHSVCVSEILALPLCTKQFLLKSIDSLRCEGLGFNEGSAIGWDEYRMKRAVSMDEESMPSLAEKKMKVC